MSRAVFCVWDSRGPAHLGAFSMPGEQISSRAAHLA